MNDWVRYFECTRRSIFTQCLRSQRLIELIMEHTPKGCRILEAGCGTALLSLLLADLGFEVTALDITPEVLEYARSRVCANNLPLNFVQGDILNLSSLFENRFFDTVCHSGVMEHFSDSDIVKSLSEQRMVSKRVIFSVPNKRTKRTSNLFGNERLMSNDEWTALIRGAGFIRVKIFGDRDLPLSMRFILPNAFFSRKGSFWWKWFSGHSIFLCEDGI